MDDKQVLHDYIHQEILDNQKGVNLTDDLDLLESGIVDSLTVVRLVSFVEERWGIRIPDVEISVEHFQSITAIAGYIQRRMTTLPAAHHGGEAR